VQIWSRMRATYSTTKLREKDLVMKLFGTDGVRGKAGEKVTASASMRLAMATGIYFRHKSIANRIVVGKDTRRSGYMVENAIVAGLTAVGYDVIQVGPIPTPAIAFLTEDMRCDAGIMISASHNPYYDNGIKFFDEKGSKLSRDIEEKIEEIYNDDELIERAQVTGKAIGKSKRIDDVIGRYIVHIKNSFPKGRTLSGMRVVVDCANGAGYKIAPTILSELGADTVVLENDPSGFNINEGCGAMHPEHLASEVLRYRADIGVALDGDADRLVMVDEKGNVVDGDKLMAVLALNLDSNDSLKNRAMVATVMSNHALDDYLSSRGITVYRSAVGDKNVVEMMQEKGLNFGGEQSGHIVFSDFAKTGDGITSALQALAYLTESGKRASEAFDPFELYPQRLVNLSVGSKRDIEKIEGIEELKARIEAEGMRYLFRYSGTENIIRLLLEGRDAGLLEERMREVEEFFSGALSR